jgi:hypothetical protein
VKFGFLQAKKNLFSALLHIIFMSHVARAFSIYSKEKINPTFFSHSIFDLFF